MFFLPPLLADAVILPARPHIYAVPVETGPVLDGKLDDDVWQRAPPSDHGFTRKYPIEGVPEVEPTTLRVVYDKENLYVAVSCAQSQSRVIGRFGRRDYDTEADNVTVSLDSGRTGTTAYGFNVNAFGVLKDSLRFNDTELSNDWDGVWDARTDIRADGWSAEFKIPFRILRFQPAKEQSWGFQAWRWIESLQESDQWAFVPKAVAGVVSHYGTLDHLIDLEPATAKLEVIPFVSGRLRRRDASAVQLANGYDVGGSAGGDIRWHPTQELTFQATVNPDFAQVEADPDVLNLTTYEWYYPERRPFFLEGFDTFQTPYQLFYTRRIGRVAPAPILATGEQAMDSPSAATIYGATKVTGKLSKRWSVGAVEAVTSETDVGVRMTDGTKVQRLVDPTTAFSVLRLKRDLGANAYLGVTATSVVHAESTTHYPIYAQTTGSPPQSLCPSGVTSRYGRRCFNDAYVAALDGRWRSPAGDYAASFQAGMSLLHNGPVRPIPDGTNLASGDTGAGAQVILRKDGGEHWTGGLSADYESPRFTYDDVGFMPRANMVNGAASLEYRNLTPWWETIEWHSWLQASARDNTYGLNLGRSISAGSSVPLKNLWAVSVNTAYALNYFDDREVGNGVALQRAGGVTVAGAVASDTTKPLATNLSMSWTRLSDGWNSQVTSDFVLHLLPMLDIQLTPSASSTSGEPRSVNQLTTAGHPIFGRQHGPSFSATLRAAYAFSPRLTLQAYGQLFLGGVHFTDFSYASPSGSHAAVALSDLVYTPMRLSTNPDYVASALNVNVVLRWEYRLGSALFVVYTRSQLPDATLPLGEPASLSLRPITHGATATDTLLVKLSYWWG